MSIIGLLLAAAINTSSAPPSGLQSWARAYKKMNTSACQMGSTRMKAYNTQTSSWVFWMSCGADSTGAFSGVSPAYLTSITQY